MKNRNINKIASIQRDKNTKTAVLKIKTEGPWQIFGGYTPDTIDYSSPIQSGTSTGKYTLDIDTNRHIFFGLRTNSEQGIIAEKHLPMAGGYNFRDLGGIENKNKQTIKWGKLFRSDDLQDLTPEDIFYLSSIPIHAIADLRTLGETKQSPDKLPPSVRRIYPLSITSGNLTPERISSYLGRDDMDKLMIEMNRSFITEPTCIDNFRILFHIMQDKTNLPLLYHCSAGKDRAGMATALILYSLGVPEETIIEDYMLSKKYLADKYAMIIEKYPQIEPLFSVKPEYLKAGIDQIIKSHKTIESFLTKTLKADIDHMQRIYLE